MGASPSSTQCVSQLLYISFERAHEALGLIAVAPMPSRALWQAQTLPSLMLCCSRRCASVVHPGRGEVQQLQLWRCASTKQSKDDVAPVRIIKRRGPSIGYQHQIEPKKILEPIVRAARSTPPQDTATHTSVTHNVPIEQLPSLDEPIRSLHDLTSQSTPPNDEAVVACLNVCKGIATELQTPSATETKAPTFRPRSSNRLLELDESSRDTSPVKSKIIKLSEALHDFVKEPKVFLSPRVLELYVQIQSTLKRPESLPEVFKLYATKPMPMRGTSPVQFKEINPNRLASAVPSRAASQALDAAIESRILPLCLDVVDTTVCTSAYRRQKMIQKLWVPAAVIVLTPPAAWALAVAYDDWQITLTSRYARTMAFGGFASYACFTSILGYIALTTSNDQMERVTWRDGLPLTTRWLREDERAMMDRIALAWGFKDRHRRGEEEGPEWDALKELVGMRDMILDRVELMDGME